MLKGICLLEYCALCFIEWIILNQTDFQTLEETIWSSSIILCILSFSFHTFLWSRLLHLPDLWVFMHLFLKEWEAKKLLWTPPPKYYIIFWKVKVMLILFDVKCRVAFYRHVFRRNSVSVDNIEYSLCVWSCFPHQGHQQQKFS